MVPYVKAVLSSSHHTPRGGRKRVIYYVYFDAYGHARRAISEKELAAKYNNDPDTFYKATCRSGPNEEARRATGHVGTLRFHDEKELNDFLQSLGDEIIGFYECGSESRPYNF
jgi:hypothetical protein